MKVHSAPGTVYMPAVSATTLPSFEDCRWGVYTEYMSVRSSNNNMLDMGTAYRVDRSGYMHVDILNNRVSTKYNGMDLRFNDGAVHILVQGNDITFGDDQVCTICRGYSAIRVFEGNTGNLSSVIRNNTIHFVPLTSSRFGINLGSAADWLVAGNTLQMADNALNLTGVQLDGCKRPEVSCNTVKGGTNGFPEDAQCAIRNAMGSDVLISCNDVDSTANGIMFNFVATDAVVRGNKMRHHKWALHLDSTAVVGGQLHKGNLWYNWPEAGGEGAWYEVDNVQASANQFLFDPATIDGGSTAPPSWEPPNWFLDFPGTNYNCGEEEYCGQFGGELCQGCLLALDQHIANDSLENDPYTEETKWILKGGLYKKLDDSPALTDSLPEFADFYADLHGSTTAAFKQIDDEQLALYDLDSTVVAQLHADRAQIEDLMTLLKNDLEHLGESSLTALQRQALIASVNGYSVEVADHLASGATAVQTATAEKALIADEVQAVNAAVYTAALIEENQKSVNEIYLATLGKDVDALTTDQANTLFTIANQCPMLGGNEVFRARSLYSLFDDTQEFDDVALCLQHGIVVKSLSEPTQSVVSVVPNPASDEAALVFTRTLTEPGLFILYDAVGSEVFRQVVPAEMPRVTFSTAQLAPALYHYQVSTQYGRLGAGKVTIVR